MSAADVGPSAYDRGVLRSVVARIRGSAAWRRRQGEHHLLGFGRTDPAPALARLPRHPEVLLRTPDWRPIAQLADQRIRAHRAEHLSVGEIVQTVSTEVGEAMLAQPLASSFGAWRTWAAATATPWPLGFPDSLADVPVSVEVELALHVQADLAELMPQLVASRLSENAT